MMAGDLLSALAAPVLTTVQLPQTHLPLGCSSDPTPIHFNGLKSGQANAYKHTISI